MAQDCLTDCAQAHLLSAEDQNTRCKAGRECTPEEFQTADDLSANGARGATEPLADLPGVETLIQMKGENLLIWRR